eukprot:7560891-Ditylum_brightwellii.AAC.2
MSRSSSAPPEPDVAPPVTLEAAEGKPISDPWLEADDDCLDGVVPDNPPPSWGCCSTRIVPPGPLSWKPGRDPQGTVTPALVRLGHPPSCSEYDSRCPSGQPAR